MASNQQGNTLTDRQQEVLGMVGKGVQVVGEIADQLQLSVPHVRGVLRDLRNNGLIEGTSGQLSVTSDGQAYAGGGGNQGNRGGRQAQGGNQGGQQRDDTRIAQARRIFEEMAEEQGRGPTIERFQNEIGMTPAGASTYYQRLRTEHGMANQNARGSGNQGNQGGRGRQGAQANQGGNQGNRGGNQGNRGGNQGNRGGNQGGNQGNRGGSNRGNASQGLNKAGNRRGMTNSNRPSAR